jgi:flagellar basal body-associated protein FliL
MDMGATTVASPIEVVVNIAGTEGDRFLKTSVIMEYVDRAEQKGGEKGKEAASPLADALNQRMPKYKSYLIDQLSKMTLPELSAPGARDKIRKDMLRVVNETLPPKLGWVKNVYFTEYIIQ